MRLQPDLPEAHMNLANILLSQKKLTEAAAHYREALRLRPTYAEALCNYGNVLRDQGDVAGAEGSFREALRLQPNFAAAHNNLGNVLASQRKYDEAMSCFEQAMRIAPNLANAYVNMGNTFNHLRRYHEAAAWCQRALQLDSRAVEAHNNLGIALLELGRAQEAETSLRNAVAIQPNLVEARVNLGNALKDQGRIEEAMECYERALQLQPGDADAHNNIGLLMDRRGSLDAAVSRYRRALELRPDYPAALTNLGNSLKEQGHFDEAQACFEQALRQRPDSADIHFNQALLLLLRGNFAQGWEEYSWRWQTKLYPRYEFTQPHWDGADLNGRTLLVYSEQGLGDTVQFIRYFPMIKQRGGRVVFWCQPALMRLLNGFQGIDELVPRPAPVPAFDVQIPLLNVPRVFQTDLESIIAPVPYLQAEPDLVADWKLELDRLGIGDGCKVGIVWQGNPAHVSDRKRSIALCHFRALARVGGVRLISLQRGPGMDQLAGLAGDFVVHDLESRLGNDDDSLSNIAAIMKNLDLVIACDTLIAHLAGALGVPVWLALPRVPEWRWLLDREDSPWYPKMRLFRQPRLDDWDDVFQRMALELSARIIQ